MSGDQWQSNRVSFGIPLFDGPNRITLTARDTVGNEAQMELLVTYLPPHTTAPTVGITFPTDAQEAATTEPQVNLSGEADDDRAVARVSWTNSRGGSGEAIGTRAWLVNGIVLQPGVNILTVTAEDTAGNTGSDTLAVTFTPNGSDPARPVLAVATPLARPFTVEAETVACTGQASGPAAIREVVWQINDGPWFAAAGTGNWTATVTPLAPGTNRLRFKAIDAMGRESLPAERVVTYRRLAPLALDGAGDTLTGLISDGTFPSAINAVRAARHTTLNPAPQAGRYTVSLPSDPAHPEATYPQGNGYGTLTVSPAGLVTLASVLGDLTPASGGVVLTKNGMLPVYLPLYAGKGSLSGWLTLREATAANQVDGTLDWFKPATAPPVWYPAAFSGEIAVEGSRYVAPPVRPQVIDTASGHLALTIGGGNIVVSPATKDLTINEANRIKIVGTEPFMMTLTLPTGLFTSSFFDASKKPRIFRGVILQTQERGAGLFKGDGQSGEVDLQPVP